MGAGLIVIDPQRTPTAEVASIHLQPSPGTDLALAASLLHVVIGEGLLDKDYVTARTTGFDAVARSVATWWPERAEAVTGVSAPLIREAAHVLARADNAYVLTGRGAEQHARVPTR